MKNSKSEILNPKQCRISKSQCSKLFGIWKISIWNLFRISILGFSILFVISNCTFAKQYDGLWFLGFNLKKKPLQSKLVRQAINYAIDRKEISQTIIGDNITPTGIVPPGMLGYDEKLKGYNFNPDKARQLLKKGKFKPEEKFVLLHTDGNKTALIAGKIIENLKAAGIKVKSKSIKYQTQDIWEKELSSGKYDLFLMGYKAADPYVEPDAEKKPDTLDLLKPLFSSKGFANFTSFSNKRVDNLIDQLSEIDINLVYLREPKLKEIAEIIQDEVPIVSLFYITKL